MRIGEIINAGFVFFTFLFSIPAIIQSNDRVWMKIHGYLVVICASMTLIIGLIIWFLTLRTRSTLSTAWGNESREVQSLLQQRV